MSDLPPPKPPLRTPSAVSPPEVAQQRGAAVSVAALVVGLVAVGLAVIPALAFDRPLLNPFAQPEPERRPMLPPEPEGGVKLRFKNWSVHIGGKTPKEEQPIEKVPAADELRLTNDPLRWFTIAAIGCALLGFALATIGHLRERHTVLTLSALVCCTAAMTWQYFAIGIALGVGAAIFLIVLAMLGAMLGGAPG